VESLNFSVESLDIGNNPKIGLEGYQYFSEKVLENDKFDKFRGFQIEGNLIGDKTLKSFLDGMKFNHHLRFLNLS
jgi:hypothetical protein